MAFAAHLLDENGDLHFATACDVENFRVVRLFDSQSDVGADFFREPFPNVARSDKFSILTRERAVVDGELHLNGGRINRHERNRNGRVRISNRFADKHIFKTGHTANISGVRFGDFDSFHSFEMEQHRAFTFGLRAVAVNANQRVANFDLAAKNFAERDSSEVIRVIQIRNEHFQIRASLCAWGRNIFNNRIKKRLHRGGDFFDIELGVAGFCAAINDWKIKLLIGCVERHEQFKNFIQNFVRAGILAINLVNDDNRFRASFERFAQNETGLRLRAIDRIDDEQHAIDHVQNTFHFAAEIRVARSVNDVDVIIFIFERGVFGTNGDALFFFQIH